MPGGTAGELVSLSDGLHSLIVSSHGEIILNTQSTVYFCLVSGNISGMEQPGCERLLSHGLKHSSSHRNV